ncbi:MAG TPA: 2OG-Fe(II) oxygenase [Caulobacterales bacterium]|nr:2OG-Fe(II) oxygenase [Caulobacterales bacterium]
MTDVIDTKAAARFADLQIGDLAPWFRQRSTSNPDFVFDTTAGRYIVLCFFGSESDQAARGRILSFLKQNRNFFDDEKASFFGVSIDPADETRLKADLPGIRYFWDFDARVSKLYGAAPLDAQPPTLAFRRSWFVLDPALRIIAIIPFAPDGADRRALAALLERLPPVNAYAGQEMQAPILFLPGVFEPELCTRLIDQYEAAGGFSSGFMREKDGKTVLVHDAIHKVRRDYIIEDEALIRATQARVRRRIFPAIQRAYQFNTTRMERYLVACYSSEDSAHFRAHRDNTTKGTAHRRFAVSINLSADFDGGEIGFPEYGTRTYKPPIGGAVVFSCSLLHNVSRVTRGRRYAFLPFLYDEAAARIREANNSFLDKSIGTYTADAKRAETP